MYGDVNTMTINTIEREIASYYGVRLESQEAEEFDFDKEFNLERAEAYLKEKGLTEEFEEWAGAYDEEEKEALLKDFISEDVSDFADYLAAN